MPIAAVNSRSESPPKPCVRKVKSHQRAFGVSRETEPSTRILATSKAMSSIRSS